jgi:hypothetical protein
MHQFINFVYNYPKEKKTLGSDFNPFKIDSQTHLLAYS